MPSGWQLIRLHRFQVHNSVTHHLCDALCVHRPKSNHTGFSVENNLLGVFLHWFGANHRDFSKTVLTVTTCKFHKSLLHKEGSIKQFYDALCMRVCMCSRNFLCRNISFFFFFAPPEGREPRGLARSRVSSIQFCFPNWFENYQISLVSFRAKGQH